MSLDELEKLLGNASPAPWSITGPAKNYRRAVKDASGEEIAWNASYYPEMFRDVDTDALVALRNEVPSLISRIRELEKQILDIQKAPPSPPSPPTN